MAMRLRACPSWKVDSGMNSFRLFRVTLSRRVEPNLTRGRRWRVLFTSAALTAAVMPSGGPSAFANQISTDTEFGIVDGGDDLACVATSPIGALLGKGVQSHPSEWEAATSLTGSDYPINDFVSAWRTGCTWAKPTPVLLAIHIENYATNSSYTGKGEAWTPDKLVETVLNLAPDGGGGTGGYIRFQRADLTKKYKSKPATANTVVIGDRRTKGKHAAQVVVFGPTSAFVIAVSSNGATDALKIAWKAAGTPFLAQVP